MQKLKRSQQRDAILDFLKTRKDHPTADFIYLNIREQIPNISLGTVYRNLSLLADTNQILRLTCDGKTDHYDANTKPHIHFMCNKCSAVIDLELDFPHNLLDLGAANFNGLIDSCNILFTGVCYNCL